MIQTNVHKACVMISLPYTLKCGQHTIDRNEKQIFSHALSVTRSKMRQVSCNFFRNAQLSQNRRQKVFNRGALRFCGRLWVCAGGLDTPKITKSQLIYSLSCFTLGDLELCLGTGLSSRSSYLKPRFLRCFGGLHRLCLRLCELNAGRIRVFLVNKLRSPILTRSDMLRIVLPGALCCVKAF